MTDRVLAPIGSFRPWAKAVADTIIDIEETKTKVTLLHVHLDPTDQAGSDTSLEEWAASRPAVETTTELLTSNGFDVELCARPADDLGRAILDTAADRAVDRLYLYARRRSSTGKAVYGSTLQRVITNATVPVVVIPSGATWETTGTDTENTVSSTRD